MRQGTGSLILASGSAARRHLLAQCGLIFDVIPADIDEAAILQDMQQNYTVTEIAGALAQQKAISVSEKHPGALVIGGDQILHCAGKLYTKAATFDEAARKLADLSGKTHQLVSAVAAAKGGKTVWHHTDTAHLTMRDLGEADIKRYLSEAGNDVLKAVGCYMLEGLGPWLFEKIEGSYYTVLGLPLLPLLGFLREEGFGP